MDGRKASAQISSMGFERYLGSLCSRLLHALLRLELVHGIRPRSGGARVLAPRVQG